MTDIFWGDYASEITGRYWFTNSGVPARPTATEVGLHTGDPGPDGAANEVSTGVWPAYTRQTVNTDLTTSPFWNDPINDASTGYLVDNNGNIDFGIAHTTASISLSYFSVWDQTGLNLIAYGQLLNPQVVASGNAVKFNSGGFNLKLVSDL